MNTRTRFTRAAVPGALSLLIAGLVLAVNADPAGAVDWSAPIALPVGWGPVIAGAVVTALTTLTTKEYARPWVKALIATGLSAVAALVVQLEAADWAFVPADLLTTFAVIWVWQLLLFLGVVKPAPAAVKLPDTGVA